MRTFKGVRTATGCEVTVDGRPLDLRLDLRNHSPDGPEWRHGGSGSVQLALAVLANLYGDGFAERHCQDFKRIIAGLPMDGWEFTEQNVDAWFSGEEVETPAKKV